MNIQEMGETGRILFRLALATVLGGCIGLERGTRRRPAGLRTFSLVCLGSALAMVLNLYLLQISPDGADVGRIPAAVVSGIGFLGVGTIFMTGKNYVRGLTTAACLWVTGILGIAIGAGYVRIGLGTFLLILFIMRIMFYMERRRLEKNRYIQLYVEVDRESGLTCLTEFVEKKGFAICSIEKQKKESVIVRKDAALEIEVDMKAHYSHSAFIAELGELEQLHYVEEVK